MPIDCFFSFFPNALRELRELKNLRRLNILQNPVTEAGVKELQNALPKCQIAIPQFSNGRGGQRGQPGQRAARGPEAPQKPVAAEKEAQAVKVVEKLGGTLTRNPGPNGQIVEVDLRGTQVKDADLKAIRELSNLHTLYLGNTRVTDAGLKELKDLKNLGFLGLMGVKVTAPAVKELQDALPSCQIYWNGPAQRQGGP